MIYITGDTHGWLNITKLNNSNFKEQETMTKNDYVIVCGDFGLVWSNSEEELWWRNWLHKKTFTTLFVDGNHENFDTINKYPVSTWNGGKIHFINDSIIHLMRGQVFTIEGKKFFTMGGASSIDKQFRKEGVSWWREELPTKKEYDEAMKNLNKHNGTVDYVLSHTCSTKIMEQLCYVKETNDLNSFFNMLDKKLIYKHWYFGHFHEDMQVDEKHTVLYDTIIPLKED